MLPVTIEELKELWGKIVTAVQERYSYLTDESMKPVEGSPAAEWQLDALERHWGIVLPHSYRFFLSLHNGVEKFAYRTPLLSTEQIIASRDEWEVVDELDPVLVRSVFAGSNYSDLFFAFDFRNSAVNGELEVVIFTIDGAQERHENFVEFLKVYLNALLAGIEREKADRIGLT